MFDFDESEESTCENDYDFHLNLTNKTNCRGRNKLRKTFVKSYNDWNIDRKRKEKLVKVSSLPIPQRSIFILSKLVINHQLDKIIKVIDTKNDCVTIHAKINLNHENYRELESDDVIIKVFTRNNHTRPDMESAKLFKGVVYSKDRNINRPENDSKYFYFPMERESLNLALHDNIVIMKMVGDKKPAPRLVDMIKMHPHLRHELYRQIIELVIRLRDKGYQFWCCKASIRNILWHNDEWNILYNEKDRIGCFSYEESDKSVKNLLSVLKVFLHFGLSRKELRETLDDLLSKRQPQRWQIDVVKKVGGFLKV